MNKLQKLINKLENKVLLHKMLNKSVSQSTIGWHIDHSLLVINGAIAQVKQSNPEKYKKKFNWKRTYIQVINKIPRGKGKAPKAVQPIAVTTIEDLNSKIEKAKQTISELEKLPENAYFSHPYFGNLNRKATIWFLVLHTKHHLKIIEDIAPNA